MGHSPEHHGVVEVADGSQAGDCPLRGKAGLHKGSRVEHAQELVDDDLGEWQWDPRLAGCTLLGPDSLGEGLVARVKVDPEGGGVQMG